MFSIHHLWSEDPAITFVRAALQCTNFMDYSLINCCYLCEISLRSGVLN